jgi:hypothetical protein
MMENVFWLVVFLGIVTFPFWAFRMPTDNMSAYEYHQARMKAKADGKTLPGSQDAWLATRDPRGSA